MGTDQAQRVSDIVGGRRYCFVVMPYRSLGLMYGHLRHVIESSTGLRCIRADEIPGSGQPLLGKVHALIEGAELVMAELSETSPNVFYEVGYAAALGKEVLAICRKGTDVPTDLQGLERIEYEDTPSELPQFDEELRRHLLILIDSDFQLLRAMLVAPESSPSYIFASPRRAPEEIQTDETLERRTYGDYLGVVGILYALGALLGKEQLPELLSGHHVDTGLLHKSCNAYIIGSSRSNALTEEAMVMLQSKASYSWRFEHVHNGDFSSLLGVRGGKPWAWKADHQIAVPEVDYGIVLRGPHPKYPKRQILIMAGTRSLGTGAACLAATRPKFIQEIRNRLPDVELADKSKTIWALVSGCPDPVDYHVSSDSMEIEEVGVIA